MLVCKGIEYIQSVVVLMFVFCISNYGKGDNAIS